MNRDMAVFYSRLLSKRISGDYDEFEDISQEEAYDLMHNSNIFILTMKSLLH